jgi:hypothetical protein
MKNNLKLFNNFILTAIFILNSNTFLGQDPAKHELNLRPWFEVRIGGLLNSIKNGTQFE